MNRIQAVSERTGAGAACFLSLKGGAEGREAGVYVHRGQMGIFTIP